MLAEQNGAGGGRGLCVPLAGLVCVGEILDIHGPALNLGQPMCTKKLMDTMWAELLTPNQRSYKSAIDY